MDISELKGEVLTHIDDCEDQILLTTKSGKKICIYHDQHCCETVRIVDTEGDLHSLI